MRLENSVIIPGVKFVTLETFRDDRGEIFATFSAVTYRFTSDGGEPLTFVEDDISISRQHTLRGLHGDDRTWKLMQCVIGEIQLVIVDMRESSPTHLRWESLRLGEHERRQVLIPAGCVVGHLVLSERSVLSYKQTQLYQGQAGQRTVRWDDPKLGIPWAFDKPRLSERDASASLL